MNAFARQMTVDEFLDWEAPEDGRWELIEGYLVRMQAEGVKHRRTKRNIVNAITNMLPADGPCEIFPEGGAVRIGEATAYIPDAILDCTIPEGDNSKEHLAPLAIFEVSVSSVARDLGEKRAAYLRFPALEHYVVVMPEHRAVLHWRRGVAEPVELGVDDTLSLDPPGIGVKVAAFFARV